MQFSGLLKLTLLDYPGKVACTLFVSGCNFRCPFCHNSDLVFSRIIESYSEEEIFAYLKTRKGILDGVCITGGEPTLYPKLPEFIAKVKALGFEVKLDTNGTNFAMLKSLTESKLIDYVAMDIKSSPERYNEAAGATVNMENINKSVQMLLSGVIDYEFRTTCVKDLISLDDFKKIGSWIKGAKRYFLQSFIDSDNNICKNLSGYDKNELENIKNILLNYVSDVSIRGT